MPSLRLLNRISTVTKEDVRELPNVFIPNEDVLTQLLEWRDNHQNEVRNFTPLVEEGTISLKTRSNFQYFFVDGDEIYHMYILDSSQYIAFLHHSKTLIVTPIRCTIDSYDKEEATKDIVTLFASVMAYLKSTGVEHIKGNIEILKV